MKTIFFCAILLCYIKCAYSVEMPQNGENITMEDIKSFLHYKDSVLENVKFIYTLRSFQPRYPEYNFKSVLVIGKAGKKLGIERLRKYDEKDEINHTLYFFDGERGYFWFPKTNSGTLYTFTPIAMSKVGEYMSYSLEWTMSSTLVKTIENDDNPEVISSYKKDRDQYVEFKCNVHSYNKENLMKIDKSKRITIDKNRIVYKCVYNLSKNIVTHRELYINEPLNSVRDIKDMLEISPGIYYPTKIISNSFEKDTKAGGFRVRGYGTFILKDIAICEEDTVIKAISFDIPRGAKIVDNTTMETSINGESHITDLSQEEKDSISVAKRLFGLSYQDLLNMMNEIE